MGESTKQKQVRSPEQSPVRAELQERQPEPLEGSASLAVQRLKAGRGALRPADVLALQGVAGNRVVQRLLEADARWQPTAPVTTPRSPVQAELDGAEVSPEAVHQAAAQGVRTSSAQLPHAEQIQQSFGHHRLDRIQAHLGPEASASATAMNAAAFATGDHVVFAGSPSLRTAAHEAAHVMQQRAGVQLAGGVGHVGDVYERHADAVAERVMAGQSAEVLLDGLGGGARPPGSAGPAVQGSAVQRIEIGFESLRNAAAIEASKRQKQKKVESISVLHGRDIRFMFPKDKQGKPEVAATYSLDAWTNKKEKVKGLPGAISQVIVKQDMAQLIKTWDCKETLLDAVLERFILAARPERRWFVAPSSDEFLSVAIKDELDVTNEAIQLLVMHLISQRAALHLRGEEAALNVGSVTVVKPKGPLKSQGADEQEVRLSWDQLLAAARADVKAKLSKDNPDAPPETPPSVPPSSTVLDRLLTGCFKNAAGFSELLRLDILRDAGEQGYEIGGGSAKKAHLSDPKKGNAISIALNHLRFVVWTEWRVLYQLLSSASEGPGQGASVGNQSSQPSGSSGVEDQPVPPPRPLPRNVAINVDQTPTRALINAYRLDVASSDAYLSQAEGDSLARAWGVQARVFTQLQRAGGPLKVYIDTVSGNFFREHRVVTKAGGDCLIHGLTVVRKGKNATRHEINNARRIIASRLSDEYISHELVSIIADYLGGNQGFHQGLGDNVEALLGGDGAAQEIRSGASSAKKSVEPSAKKESSGSGQSKPPEQSSSKGGGQHAALPGIGTLAPSVTYGVGGKAGLLMFQANPAHYIALEPFPLRNGFDAFLGAEIRILEATAEGVLLREVPTGDIWLYKPGAAQPYVRQPVGLPENPDWSDV